MKNLILASILLLSSLAFASQSDDQWQEIHGNGKQTEQEKKASMRRAQRIADEIDGQDNRPLAQRTDRSLAAMIHIGVLNLRRHGYKDEAKQLEQGYRKFDGYVEKVVTKETRDIGDFKPLSEWLAVAYELLELKLGYQICYTLRLTDIKTINYAVPVVFSPCKYGLDEFELHFIHDMRYRGLAPVVTYWTTVLTCTVATYGAGYFFVCSPLAMGVEFAMDKWIAPAIAPKIYNLVCK